MKNSFGNNLSITIFGESHGECIGATLDSPCPGIRIDTDLIDRRLSARRPSGSYSTKRIEKDEYRFISGLCDGITTGAPLTVIIPNKNTDNGFYNAVKFTPRPSHADYASFVRYGTYTDNRGGGRFSGRMTAAITALGSVAEQMLNLKGIRVATHISFSGDIFDRGFKDYDSDMDMLDKASFPVLDADAGRKIINRIISAAEIGDSVGAVTETAVTGIPAGTGEPFFDSCEGMLSHILFSIPGIKGVEFGDGFLFGKQTGIASNDEFVSDNGRIKTLTNHSGGINGGLTNGMPVIFRCAVRPTPSVAIPQKTVDLKTGENTEITIEGRHDPAFFHRACPVIAAAAALTFADLLITRFGADYFVNHE